MLNRAKWYGLNVVSWIVGAGFIGAVWYLAVGIRLWLGWTLFDRPGDVTALWMMLSLVFLMSANMSGGTPEENKRKHTLFAVLAFLSVISVQISIGLFIIVAMTSEWSALSVGLGGLIFDALVLRTLMRWLIRPAPQSNT